MPDEDYNIKDALKYAKITNQSVNVGLNTGEAKKIEGSIKKISENSFCILQEETYDISQVEYVEYS